MPTANALMLGKDVFRAPPKGVTYLGTEVRSAMPCCCFWLYSALTSLSIAPSAHNSGRSTLSSGETSSCRTSSTRSEVTDTESVETDSSRSSMSILTGKFSRAYPVGRTSRPGSEPLLERVLIRRHMHQISDGERRRVQLVMGLMVRARVKLLPETFLALTGPEHPDRHLGTSSYSTRSRSTWMFSYEAT